MYKRYRNKDFNGGKKRLKLDNFEDDTGIVHYRDASHLLRSPPGYDVKKSRKQIKEKITLQEGSLFNMCLKFIAVNIDILDSLVGMPEIIGEQLFSYMIKEKVFNFEINSNGSFTSYDHLKLKKLALFDEAYNELLLKSLTLVKVPENIELIPLLCSFENLTELDLSGRTLPDELFSILSKFYCLEKLILQKTKLTDRSIVKLTLPYRMFKENPQQLEVLDISDNCVTNASIELLLTFTSLKSLNLTGTSLNLHFYLVYELKQFGWQLSRDEPTYSQPETVGWAEPIISFLHRRKQVDNPGGTKAAKFYSTKKKGLRVPVKKDNVRVPVKKDNLILIRSWFPNHSIKFNRAVLLDSVQSKPLCIGKNTKTDKIISNKNDKTGNINAEQNFFSCETENNEDIFQQYNECTFSSRKTLLEYL